MDKKDLGPQKLTNIFTQLPQAKKPPAYKWQDLALRIIQELGVPNFKRNSVFKVCKDNPEEIVLKVLNDTKELCQTGNKWQYFFKVITGFKKTPEE